MLMIALRRAHNEHKWKLNQREQDLSCCLASPAHCAAPLTFSWPRIIVSAGALLQLYGVVARAGVYFSTLRSEISKVNRCTPGAQIAGAEWHLHKHDGSQSGPFTNYSAREYIMHANCSSNTAPGDSTIVQITAEWWAGKSYQTSPHTRFEFIIKRPLSK